MTNLIERMNKDINELTVYAQLEGSELGEYCSMLISIAQYHPYQGKEMSCKGM